MITSPHRSFRALACFLVPLALGACKRPAGEGKTEATAAVEAPTVPSVRFTKVLEASLPPTLEASGTLAADELGHTFEYVNLPYEVARPAWPTLTHHSSQNRVVDTTRLRTEPDFEVRLVSDLGVSEGRRVHRHAVILASDAARTAQQAAGPEAAQHRAFLLGAAALRRGRKDA